MVSGCWERRSAEGDEHLVYDEARREHEENELYMPERPWQDLWCSTDPALP